MAHKHDRMLVPVIGSTCDHTQQDKHKQQQQANAHQWAPSIKNAEDSSSESRSAESSEITRNNRTALNLSPSKLAQSLQKKIWRRLRERLSRAARRLDEDSLEIHSPAVESIHSR